MDEGVSGRTVAESLPEANPPHGQGGKAHAGTLCIGSGIRIMGDVAIAEDAELWVAGAIEGNIAAPLGRLTVTSGGRIRGDVRVREAQIEGAIQGDIDVSDGLTMDGSGSLRGRVSLVARPARHSEGDR